MRQSRGLLRLILLAIVVAAFAACQGPGGSEQVGRSHQDGVAIAG
jgi:hypothetical protein